MGKRRKKKRKQYQGRAGVQRGVSSPATPAAYTKVAQKEEQVTAGRHGSRWLKPVAISAIGGLIVVVVTVFTPLFKSRLGVVDIPAIVNNIGVMGNAENVRHQLDLYFCVRNTGFVRGNVGRIAVNAVGLAEAPSIVVQELDHAPIDAFEKRGISAKILVLDRMSLPEETTMRIDVYDEADRWIGDFALDTRRPISFTREGGSESMKASVHFAGLAADACRRRG